MDYRKHSSELADQVVFWGSLIVCAVGFAVGGW